MFKNKDTRLQKNGYLMQKSIYLEEDFFVLEADAALEDEAVLAEVVFLVVVLVQPQEELLQFPYS